MPAVSHGSRVVCVCVCVCGEELNALGFHCLFLARDKHELNALDSRGDGLCLS